MPDPLRKVDVAEWVRKAKPDREAYKRRQAVEVTLNVIAMTAEWNAVMFLKGGILMSLAYGSPRHTADIDLTTTLNVESDVGARIQGQLDSKFPSATAELGYPDLIVKTHSVKTLPPGIFADAKYPALKIRIGSAMRGTTQERALQKRQASVVIDTDISFNEPVPQTQVLILTGGRKLLAYSLPDLVAEKYRAIIQQVTRKRNRRQDVYDLHWLITQGMIGAGLRKSILKALKVKCHARLITPKRESLDEPEIMRRAGADWNSMELELGTIPDFEDCFARVALFYRDLPW